MPQELLARVLPRSIRGLQIVGKFKLRLRFDDGRRRTVNIEPLVKRGGVFAPLSKPKLFQSVRIGEGGRSLQWSDDLDLCADALWLQGVAIRE